MASRTTALGAAFAAQRRVIWALMLREVGGRFGRHGLGYLWAVVDPVLLVVTFIAIRYALGANAPHGMDIVPFIVTGLITFRTFMDVRSRVTGAVQANRALLAYPLVTSLDTMVARFLLESATYIVIFTLLVVATVTAGLSPVPADPLVMSLVLATAALLGFATGVCVAVLINYFPVFEHVAGPFFRVMFFTSGIFFMAGEMPPALREWLLWNPMLHLTEIMRAHYFPGTIPHYGTWSYPLSILVPMTFLALLLDRIAFHGGLRQ